MKLYRNAIILVVIVALMGAAYYFVNKNKSSTGGDTAPADNSKVIQLISYENDKVDNITLTNTDGTLVISKGKDAASWTLASPADVKVDATQLSSIATNATSITAEKVIEENAADKVMYGLDKPIVLTVKGNDNTEKTLLIGSPTPTKTSYYVMLKDSAKVYTVSSYTAEQFLVKLADIKDKAILALNIDDIINVSMDRNGQNVFKAKKNADTSWALLAPIEGNVNSSAIGPMITAVSTITAAGFEDNKSTDLEQYGLANPPYVFSFETSSAKYKLLLGKEKTKGSQIYAMLDGTKDVFVLDETPFNFLDKPFKEIIEVFAYISNIDNVNRIELTMDGKTTKLGLDVYKAADGSSDADKDKFTVDGKEASGKDSADKQPFRDFYQSLIAISLDEIDVSGVPSGTPEISIKYYLKSAPGTMQVDFVSKDANYYYVLRNGKYANILVRKDKGEYGILGMKESYKKLTDFLATAK